MCASVWGLLDFHHGCCCFTAFVFKCLKANKLLIHALILLNSARRMIMPFQQYFSCIGKENQKNPPACRKSRTNFTIQ